MEKEREKEMCVSCEKWSGYYKDIPIDQRKNYIECAGQLCDGCAENIYGQAKFARKEGPSAWYEDWG